MKNLLSKAVVDVQWAFVSIATASLAHFLLRMILGRELGAEGLGAYTLAFTIYLLGMQFAAFGIGSAMTKYVAEYLEDRAAIRNYVSSGMTSSIITGVLMGLVLFLMAPFIANSFFNVPELTDPIRLTALCYPFMAVQKAVLGTLNGFRRMRSIAFLEVVQNVTVVAMSAALVLAFGMGVTGAVIGFVVPTIAISAVCPLLIRDCVGRRDCLWNVPALRATTAFGFYVVLGNSIGFLNTQVDNILIGFYMSPSDVGIYAVAVLFATTFTLIPSAVQRVTAPATATLYGKGDMEGIRRLFYSTLKKSLLVSGATAIVMVICAPYLIPLLFTEAFAESYVPLLVLLIGYPISASFGAVGATLSSIGRVQIPFRIGAVCVVLNIVLNILLIPPLGINGAALATSIAMLANFVITLKVIGNYLGDRRLAVLLKYLIQYR